MFLCLVLYFVCSSVLLVQICFNLRCLFFSGTLHFTYVLRSDEQSSRYYACAMSNAVEGQIKLGGKTKLVVAPTSSSKTHLVLS